MDEAIRKIIIILVSNSPLVVFLKHISSVNVEHVFYRISIVTKFAF